MSLAKNRVGIKTLNKVEKNEELLVRYGRDFFGVDNANCECKSCER